MDQAEALRRRSSGTPKMGVPTHTRVVSFTSGKGGVGKTNVVLNTAIALAREGRSVLVLDADLGLANIDILLDLEVQGTIHDVVSGRRDIEEIVLDGPEGTSIIPAASGVESMTMLTAHQRMLLMQAIESIAYRYDYLLVDTGAGIGQEVLHFNSAANEIVIVINDEPTSLTDAYAMVKVLSRSYGEKAVSVLANDVPSEEVGERAFRKLSAAIERFLHVQVRYIGCIPTDEHVGEAIREQRALLEVYPSSQAGRAVGKCAQTLDESFYNRRMKGGMQFFFERLLEVNADGR